MAWDLLILEEAEKDLDDAFCWYELQVKGLGRKFISCIEDALQFIRKYPNASPEVYKNIRRRVTPKFPFGVYYLLDEDFKLIRVIAFLHFKRGPKIIKNRF